MLCTFLGCWEAAESLACVLHAVCFAPQLRQQHALCPGQLEAFRASRVDSNWRTSGCMLSGVYFAH